MSVCRKSVGLTVGDVETLTKTLHTGEKTAAGKRRTAAPRLARGKQPETDFPRHCVTK